MWANLELCCLFVADYADRARAHLTKQPTADMGFSAAVKRAQWQFNRNTFTSLDNQQATKSNSQLPDCTKPTAIGREAKMSLRKRFDL